VLAVADGLTVRIAWGTKMLARNVLSLGVAAALCVLSSSAPAADEVRNRAVELVGAGAASDPLIAVEANRAGIVNRLVNAYGADVTANGVPVDVFRAALANLRADQLLAAALVSSAAEVTAIVAHPPASGDALQRFVPLAPSVPKSMDQVPLAEAYLMRDADGLSVVRARDLQLGVSTAQLVGYFAPATTTLVAAPLVTAPASAAVVSSAPLPTFGVVEKDGSGSGANSWIGFTAGNNQAAGNGSAVAAGTFNLAGNTNAAVFAGQSNVASGVSSLVIGGFDNRATGIDSLVGAGAGHRATGARSVIVGGGYNLASGQWSFVGGGGRSGTASSAAGTNPLDNVASGDFSAVPGGQGNIASGTYSSIPGGVNNTASGVHSVAIGSYGTAGGVDSVTIGCAGQATHAGAILISARSGGTQCGSDLDFTSAAANEVAIRATGGVRVVTHVNNVTGAPTAGVVVAAGGGSWSSLSDVNAKRDLELADAKSVLAKVAAMPVYTWRYITELSGALHMGPTAQDFRAAFGLGDSDRRITTVDEGGVALAAIKGLKQEIDEKNAEIDALKLELRAIKQKLGLR
jgi:hypothetical protein